MEASGHARWYERLLAELNFELWMGDAAKIRAKQVRKRKTDRWRRCAADFEPHAEG
jgi:transposase